MLIQLLKKENSLFFEVPWRIFKMYSDRWKDSESWAEAISCLGEFLRKREEIRSPSPYQQSLLKLTGDAISFGSSLIHWYKMAIDSTPSYKNGVRSIYINAIFEQPRKLGEGITVLTRLVLNAVNSPRNPQMFEHILVQAPKVAAVLAAMMGLLACCSDTHKGMFSTDHGVIKKALDEMQALKPAFPLNEITQAAIAVAKGARRLAGLDASMDDDEDLGGSSSVGSSGPVTPSQVQQSVRELSRVIETNLALLRRRGGQEQMYASSIQTSFAKVEACVQQIVGNCDVTGKPVGQLSHVAAEATAGCKEIVSAAAKVFTDFTE